jgi:acetyltransferase-like isoleucine patch superfamily enzyme
LRNHSTITTMRIPKLKSLIALLRILLLRNNGDPLSLFTADYAKGNSYLSVTAGRGTYGTPEIVGHLSERLTIGSFTSIAAGVKIVLVNHVTEGVSTYPFRNVNWVNKAFMPIQIPDVHAKSKGPVRIGSDVWLGNSAIILPGVSIGDGAVVGAQAVVSKDVPPYAVAVGNPAQVVKYRFDSDQIRALLQICWWDWDDDVLSAAESDFFLPIDEFIAKYS